MEVGLEICNADEDEAAEEEDDVAAAIAAAEEVGPEDDKDDKIIEALRTELDRGTLPKFCFHEIYFIEIARTMRNAG